MQNVIAGPESGTSGWLDGQLARRTLAILNGLADSLDDEGMETLRHFALVYDVAPQPGEEPEEILRALRRRLEDMAK